ncbi:hypothetical protein [Sphingomonas antarctica]|uniref:hypothetical protein n=1 Tax=Sphingomonas antarctica TaxID=2040274 RepID=UPI0039ED4138
MVEVAARHRSLGASDQCAHLWHRSDRDGIHHPASRRFRRSRINGRDRCISWRKVHLPAFGDCRVTIMHELGHLGRIDAKPEALDLGQNVMHRTVADYLSIFRLLVGRQRLAWRDVIRVVYGCARYVGDVWIADR